MAEKSVQSNMSNGVMEKTALPGIAAVSPQVHLANPPVCAQEILAQATEAVSQGAHLVVFPELALTGATCGDLFFQGPLIKAARRELIKLTEETKNLSAVLVVGLPLQHASRLYNVAAVLAGGEILGIVPKMYREPADHLEGKASQNADRVEVYGGASTIKGLSGVLVTHETEGQSAFQTKNLNVAKNLYFHNMLRDQHEQRWFSNGAYLDTTIKIAGQSVPCQPHLVFEIPGASGKKTASIKPRGEQGEKNNTGRKAESETFIAEAIADGISSLSVVVTIGNEFFFDVPDTFLHLASSRESGRNATQGTSKVGPARNTDYHCVLIANPHATPAIAAPLSLETFVRVSACERGLALVRAGAGEGESTTDCVLNGTSYVLAPPELKDTCPTSDARPQQDEFPASSAQGDDTALPCKTDKASAELLAQDVVSPQPFTTPDLKSSARIAEEAFAIQTKALVQRLKATGIRKVVIGISGGLDSTLALLVSGKAFDGLEIPRQNIHAISMPGLGTTKTTRSNAECLAQALGVSYQEIPIANAVAQHFEDIGHDPAVQNAAYENAQARERTQILMDFANDSGALVVGTGDMSEAALGWATFNGDHMSMYNVNAGVPKTLVRAIVATIADNLEREGEAYSFLDASVKRAQKPSKNALAKTANYANNAKKSQRGAALAAILRAILDTPISPELLPPSEADTIKQKTEDVVGPYELHDFFLYHFIYLREAPSEIYKHACTAFPQTTPETILSWLRVFLQRFFSQQFKRNCAVDGPQVVAFSLSPRLGFEMPSDAQVDIWLEELNRNFK